MRIAAIILLLAAAGIQLPAQSWKARSSTTGILRQAYIESGGVSVSVNCDPKNKKWRSVEFVVGEPVSQATGATEIAIAFDGGMSRNWQVARNEDKNAVIVRASDEDGLIRQIKARSELSFRYAYAPGKTVAAAVPLKGSSDMVNKIAGDCGLQAKPSAASPARSSTRRVAASRGGGCISREYEKLCKSNLVIQDLGILGTSLYIGNSVCGHMIMPTSSGPWPAIERVAKAYMVNKEISLVRVFKLMGACR